MTIGYAEIYIFPHLQIPPPPAKNRPESLAKIVFIAQGGKKRCMSTIEGCKFH
jgi:hypothetical protein